MPLPSTAIITPDSPFAMLSMQALPSRVASILSAAEGVPPEAEIKRRESRISLAALKKLDPADGLAYLRSFKGVGPKTAGRILEVIYDDDEELVRRIFQDEVKFARTRRFWD